LNIFGRAYSRPKNLQIEKVPYKKVTNKKVPNKKVPNKKVPNKKVPNKKVPNKKVPNKKYRSKRFLTSHLLGSLKQGDQIGRFYSSFLITKLARIFCHFFPAVKTRH
jgi:hypothetical protein